MGIADDAVLFDRPVVIFDLDGTLADTSHAIMATARRVLEENGFAAGEITDMRLRSMVGPPLDEGFHDLFGFSALRAEQACARYRELFGSVDPSEYPPMPCAVELLDELAAQGRTLAVATSRREDVALRLLDELELLDRFAAVAGMREPIRRTKAASIAAALRMLDARPDEAVMVGDRFHDVEGAHEMGLPAIGVYTGTAERGEFERAGAEATCHGLDEVLTRMRRDHG